MATQLQHIAAGSMAGERDKDNGDDYHPRVAPPPLPSSSSAAAARGNPAGEAAAAAPGARLEGQSQELDTGTSPASFSASVASASAASSDTRSNQGGDLGPPDSSSSPPPVCQSSDDADMHHLDEASPTPTSSRSVITARRWSTTSGCDDTAGLAPSVPSPGAAAAAADACDTLRTPLIEHHHHHRGGQQVDQPMDFEPDCCFAQQAFFSDDDHQQQQQQQHSDGDGATSSSPSISYRQGRRESSLMCEVLEQSEDTSFGGQPGGHDTYSDFRADVAVNEAVGGHSRQQQQQREQHAAWTSSSGAGGAPTPDYCPTTSSEQHQYSMGYENAGHGRDPNLSSASARREAAGNDHHCMMDVDAAAAAADDEGDKILVHRQAPPPPTLATNEPLRESTNIIRRPNLMGETLDLNPIDHNNNHTFGYSPPGQHHKSGGGGGGLACSEANYELDYDHYSTQTMMDNTHYFSTGQQQQYYLADHHQHHHHSQYGASPAVQQMEANVACFDSGQQLIEYRPIDDLVAPAAPAASGAIGTSSSTTMATPAGVSSSSSSSASYYAGGPAETENRYYYCAHESVAYLEPAPGYQYSQPQPSQHHIYDHLDEYCPADQSMMCLSQQQQPHHHHHEHELAEGETNTKTYLLLDSSTTTPNTGHDQRESVIYHQLGERGSLETASLTTSGAATAATTTTSSSYSSWTSHNQLEPYCTGSGAGEEQPQGQQQPVVVSNQYDPLAELNWGGQLVDSPRSRRRGPNAEPPTCWTNDSNNTTGEEADDDYDYDDEEEEGEGDDEDDESRASSSTSALLAGGCCKAGTQQHQHQHHHPSHLPAAAPVACSSSSSRSLGLRPPGCRPETIARLKAFLARRKQGQLVAASGSGSGGGVGSSSMLQANRAAGRSTVAGQHQAKTRQPALDGAGPPRGEPRQPSRATCATPNGTGPPATSGGQVEPSSQHIDPEAAASESAPVGGGRGGPEASIPTSAASTPGKNDHRPADTRRLRSRTIVISSCCSPSSSASPPPPPLQQRTAAVLD